MPNRDRPRTHARLVQVRCKATRPVFLSELTRLREAVGPDQPRGSSCEPACNEQPSRGRGAALRRLGDARRAFSRGADLARRAHPQLIARAASRPLITFVVGCAPVSTIRDGTSSPDSTAPGGQASVRAQSSFRQAGGGCAHRVRAARSETPGQASRAAGVQAPRRVRRRRGGRTPTGDIRRWEASTLRTRCWSTSSHRRSDPKAASRESRTLSRQGFP